MLDRKYKWSSIHWAVISTGRRRDDAEYYVRLGLLDSCSTVAVESQLPLLQQKRNDTCGATTRMVSQLHETHPSDAHNIVVAVEGQILGPVRCEVADDGGGVLIENVGNLRCIP